jgi:hypothetical protein
MDNSAINIAVSNSLKDVVDGKVVVNGELQNMAEGWIVVGGVWKRVWPPTIAPSAGYGSDFCNGGTASADSVYSGYLASKAFDDTSVGAAYGSYFWCSTAAPGYPHWIKYDLGDGVTKIVAQYKITARSPTYNESSAWKLQGSNNDLDWTDIDTQTGISWTEGETKTFNSFINTTAYRYYRIYLTTTGHSSNNAEIDEIEMMEAL